MKTQYLYIAFVATALLAACEKEDAVQPDLKDTSFYFTPNDTCTDEESVMRRQFFNDHGSYLLFNDTLQHYFVGTDINGDSAYFTEKLELSYNVGGTVTTSRYYYFNLMTNLTRKKAAVEFLEDNILYHFSGSLQPFSWMIANRIYYYNGLNTTNPVAASGQRAIAVAMENLARIRTEAQKKNFTQQILTTIVDKVVSDNSTKFTRFSSISSSLYSRYFTGYDKATASECLEYVKTKGFLSRGKNPTWGGASNEYYPGQSDDLGDFARLVVVYDMETIESTYAAYPVVIQKAKVMRECLENVGYVFEKDEEKDE